MTEAQGPPIPVPDEVSARFWEAAAEGRLVIQRCPRSGRYLHPPQRLCPCCARAELGFEPVSGRGRIYTFSVMRDPRVQGFESRVPYVTIWVELVEQPLLLLVSDLPGVDPERVAIGQPVEVRFETLRDGTVLPKFALAD